MSDTKYIFLDTNNWIYLSNGYDILNNGFDEIHFKLFDVLRRGVRTELLKMLTNEIVIDEWNRHINSVTDKQIQRITNQHKERIKNLDAIAKLLPDEINSIDRVKLKLQQLFIDKKNEHLKHISEVRSFFNEKTVKITVSEDAKEEAIQLALKKKAPFTGDKSNSMADALIFLSAVEYISLLAKDASNTPFVDSLTNTDLSFAKNKEFPESYFASSNKGDFSSKDKPKEIHPHLKPYLSKINCKYKFSLKDLVLSLEDDVLTYEEILYLDEFEKDAPCEYCYTNDFPSVNYSRTIKVDDESIDSSLIGQYIIPFEGKGRVYTKEDYKTELRIATCYHCGTDYLECPCGMLNYIEVTEEINSCENDCGRAYLFQESTKANGVEITLVRDNRCIGCDERYSELDKERLCEFCHDFYQ